jgi:hypothetical protein
VRAVLLILVLAACGKGDRGISQSALLADLGKAGLTVSAFSVDKSGAIGKDCSVGTVSGVEVAICSFAKPEEAAAAEDKALEWVGASTGAALVRGNVTLAAADRAKVDPSGRTLNVITKTFRGR